MARALIDGRMLEQLADFFPSICSIQKSISIRDSTGYPVPAWADFAGHANLPCRKAPKGGGETRRPDQTYATDAHTIELRDYYPDITTVMKVKMGTTYYNILLIEHDGQNKMTRITAELIT